MDTKQTLHMNPGEGETSYARNSAFQSAEQSRMKPLIEEAIMDLCCTTTPLPRSMLILELGCSSGPSALTLVSMAVDAVRRQYVQLQQPPPELCLLLNDLPSNDFNTVVKRLASLRERHEDAKGGEGFSPLVTGIVPGSFHGRLLTTGCMHLVCSSNSLHWLSEAPEDLVKNSIPMYDGNEHLLGNMRPVVLDAYARQFRNDFMVFLGLRAKEMVPGGRMVLSFTGTRSPDPATEPTQTWELIGRVLDDMASRGIIDKEKLKSFYIPIYAPSEREVKEIIEQEGSFSISKLQVHDSMSGVDKGLITPKMIAHGLRAGFESIIVQHFGSSAMLMDEFVRTAEDSMNIANLQDELAKNPRVFLAMSLAKRS